MKKSLFLAPILLLLFGLTTGYALDEKLSALLQHLNTNESTAKADIFHAITTSSFSLPNAKALKTLSAEERIAAITTAGAFVKTYLASPEGIERYNRYREEKKPRQPEAPKSMAQIKDTQRENLKNSIAEMEKSKAQVGKDQQAMLDEMIGAFKKQLQEIDDPKNSLFSREMEGSLQQAYAAQMKDYAAQVAAWENQYPKDNPKSIIKAWLTTFLEKTASIDFDAKTIETSNGKRKFVDPQYERKDSQWKLYFRAGRETVAAARTFAQNWLNELNI